VTKARLDGLYLFLLGSVALILLSVFLESVTPNPTKDFKVIYYPARCLIQHCDPYNEREVLRIYQAEAGELQSESPLDRANAVRNMYPPSAFSLAVPAAILPWGPAHILWMMLTAGGLLFASFLAWNLGASYAPILSGMLIGFLLANSELLVVLGNPSGIVISLCVVAVWCFLRERLVPVGILCLAISLAVKPQEAGLIWLYFLLAGGVYRKHALQTLLAAVALSLPSVLWTWQLSPHWIQELHSNLLAYSVHGGTTDPGPASSGPHGSAMMVNLQTFFSVFRDDPRFYNPATYLVCAPLLLVWAFVTLRFGPSAKRAWLALAAISVLSLLPVYHRLYDTKLLLLTVPACAMLWAEGGLNARLALLVNTVGFVLTGDIPRGILSVFIGGLHLPATKMSMQILTVVEAFPVPLILLVMGIFYLWVYVQCCLGRSHAQAGPSAGG
jgi:hypothetical protein